MALILKDRVKESSSSSGTGSITLGGAFVGYQTFNAAVASGSTVYYTIHNTTAGNDSEWEVGVGTFTAPSTLSRDTVLSSSAGAPTKTNFTGSSVLEVFITQPAGEAVYINQATGKVEAFGNGANIITFTEINTTNLTASTVTLTNGTISTNAANATDITNKTYVDGLFATGISYHEPVLVEEDVALNAVYVQPNGAGNGVGATLTNNGANAALVVDGVSVANTARILVYAQANAVQNGVYTVTNPGNATAQWVLTRATDADTFGLANPNTLGKGDAFFVTAGNTGAGRTYIVTTAGTITFGSTNITFAQISSAQIYAAGTGLNLANLTFSISNTAVTAAQYGNDGAVGQFTVNAQGQLTNAANVSINASSISVGTLANGRTTAASANGASTIVLRDSNGDFAANTITATTSNATTFNGTTGAFTNVSGNGVALTAINASNVTSGTLDNGRTTGNTANSASTIVLRDATGNFGANTISGAFSGDGSAINAINASNISSGTVANARTSAASANGASTIVLRDGSGGFGAGDITALSISGNGVALTAINASNIASGTIANARTTADSANGASTIVLRGSSGEFAAGAITGTSLSGNVSATVGTFGAGSNTAPSITTTGDTNTGIFFPAADTIAFTEGGVESMRIDSSGNVGIGTTTPSSFSDPANNLVVGTTSGNHGITIAAGTTALSSIYLADGTTGNEAYRGFLEYGHTSDYMALGTAASERMRIFSTGGVSIGNTTDPGATNLSVTGTIAGNGAPLTGINASNISSGTIANARTTAATANGASTIVARDASGNFAAGTITATLTGTASLLVTGNSYQVGSLGVGTAASGTTGEIRATNNVTAYYSSDERLKDNVQVITNALAKVLQIRGVEFDWNNLDEPEDGYFVRKHDIGVIAQEIEKVLPEVVGTREDGIKAVKYDRIIPLLIEAIKELKAEVDALKGE